MIMRHNYPYSPPSESDLASTNTSPETKTSQITTMADDEDIIPSSSRTTTLLTNTKLNRVQSAVRRARSPPRNEHNQMYCDHVNCNGKNQTFKRVCEWNKHMDRHERPYKCRENGCELNPGFTYSGGLLRHQREVHKMHLSTKQPLFCPFPNCNRSSGTGFTRRENLEEHKRRRHLEEMSDRGGSSNRDSSHPPSATIASQHMMGGEPMFKRRRISSTTATMMSADDVHRLEPERTSTTTATTTGTNHPPLPPHSSSSSVAIDTSNGVAVLSESELVRWLRAEIQRKDEIIVRHATELHRLQNLLRALPPQTVYGVMQPRGLPGGVSGSGG